MNDNLRKWRGDSQKTIKHCLRKKARETIERVHKMHAEHCPVYRSLYKAIDITTEYQLHES
ncbi:MAG: hypothetical protein ACR2L1_03130 [Pyrinomonadaceae bacterium]